MKIIFGILIALAAILMTPASALAAKTIDSATLNGASSVTVLPSASITVQVNATLSGGGGGDDWGSTSYQVGSGGTSCVDHANITSSGSFSQSFTITAPSSNGTYDVNFIIWRNNTCDLEPSSTFTLTGGIVVATPTPTPTATPTPTPTPGATPTPTPQTTTPGLPDSGSASSGTLYYPSITLQRNGLVFSGNATVENGVIDQVEYSLDGSTWHEVAASDGKFDEADESFSFSPSTPFKAGSRTVYARAKSLAQVYSETASVNFTVTPPAVVLDDFTANPTDDTTPTITGSASSTLSVISAVQLSLDGGDTWLGASRLSGKFSLTPEALEDGNYEIIARAFDSAGNVGFSESKTLVIDTIPPIVGGGTLMLGPTVLEPRQNVLNLITGADVTVAVTLKGGVTKANAIVDGLAFTLKEQKGSDLWIGKIGFNEPGEKELTITAIDGANNSSERSFGKVFVRKPGEIKDLESGQKIAEAEVSLYYFDASNRSWVLWEAQSYGQTNPQTQSELGYSFMVPPGKYYLEASSAGHHKTQSQIFSLDETTALNFDFALRSKPTLIFTLPFIGRIILTIPEFLAPPDSITIDTTPEDSLAEAETLIGKNVSLTLLNPEGQEVSLSSFEGKKLLLTFISPLFPQALAQAAILSNLALSEDSQILVVSLQQSAASTRVLMQRGAYRFPVVFDKDGLSATEFQVNYLPKSYFIDKAGKVSKIHTGVLSEKEILESFTDMQ